MIVGASPADNNGRARPGRRTSIYGFGATTVTYGPLTGLVGQAITPLTPVIARTGTATFSARGCRTA